MWQNLCERNLLPPLSTTALIMGHMEPVWSIIQLIRQSIIEIVLIYQGLRLRCPSMLNTRYFRFGREFRLSVCPLGRDFYEENISALEANFGWQEV